MIIELWLEFLAATYSFEPFYYIVAALVALCSVLLMRSLKVL